MRYERTQYGYLVGGILVIILMFLGALLSSSAGLLGFFLEGAEEGLLVVWFLLALATTALFFPSLKVVVEPSCVRIKYGVGLLRRRIPIGRIESARPVRNSWWYGLGIRLTPHGWLWSIHGLDAVELTYSDGGHFRIGTADPEGLSAAINEACKDLSWA